MRLTVGVEGLTLGLSGGVVANIVGEGELGEDRRLDGTELHGFKLGLDEKKLEESEINKKNTHREFNEHLDAGNDAVGIGVIEFVDASLERLRGEGGDSVEKLGGRDFGRHWNDGYGSWEGNKRVGW